MKRAGDDMPTEIKKPKNVSEVTAKQLIEAKAAAEQRIEAAKQRFNQAQAEFGQAQDAFDLIRNEVAQEIIEAQGAVKLIDSLLDVEEEKPDGDDKKVP